MSDLFKALLKVQGAVRGVKRDAKNPHFKNNYATLEAVTDTIRPHMQEAGLVWLQAPGSIRDGAIQVTTIIVHAESGERHEFTMEMPLAKKDPQGAGSALTYACRYSLMAALGLPPTDDDAETAIDRNNTRPEPELKSSAALKRDGAWEKVVSKLAEDMLDVNTFGQFEMLKADYRDLATKERWNRTFMEQLKDVFEGYADELQKKIAAENDTVADIQEEFPGARVVSDKRIQSPLEAGE